MSEDLPTEGFQFEPQSNSVIWTILFIAHILHRRKLWLKEFWVLSHWARK